MQQLYLIESYIDDFTEFPPFHFSITRLFTAHVQFLKQKSNGKSILSIKRNVEVPLCRYVIIWHDFYYIGFFIIHFFL